jgi:hypothetical protein
VSILVFLFGLTRSVMGMRWRLASAAVALVATGCASSSGVAEAPRPGSQVRARTTEMSLTHHAICTKRGPSEIVADSTKLRGTIAIALHAQRRIVFVGGQSDYWSVPTSGRTRILQVVDVVKCGDGSVVATLRGAARGTSVLSAFMRIHSDANPGPPTWGWRYRVHVT